MAVVKFSPDAENYAFDFRLQASIVAEDTIASVQTLTFTPIQPADATALTVGAPSINGTQVVMRLSDGQAGALYLGTCVILTAGGKLLTSVMQLDVPV